MQFSGIVRYSCDNVQTNIREAKLHLGVLLILGIVREGGIEPAAAGVRPIRVHHRLQLF